MSIPDAFSAATLLQTRLQTRFDNDYVSDFSSYGGVDVVLSDKEPSEPEEIGRPCLVLWVAEESDAPDYGWQARAVRIGVKAMATDFSGGRIGASNPVGSDTLLSKTLHAIIRADYTYLRDAGFLAANCIARTESNKDGTFLNPHEITGVILP